MASSYVLRHNMRRRLPAVLIIFTAIWLFLHTWQSMKVHEDYVSTSTAATTISHVGLLTSERSHAEGKFQEVLVEGRTHKHTAHADKGPGRGGTATSGEGSFRESEQESEDEGYSRLREMARRVQRDGVIIMVMGSKGEGVMEQYHRINLVPHESTRIGPCLCLSSGLHTTSHAAVSRLFTPSCLLLPTALSLPPPPRHATWTCSRTGPCLCLSSGLHPTSHAAVSCLLTPLVPAPLIGVLLSPLSSRQATWTCSRTGPCLSLRSGSGRTSSCLRRMK